ncbi:MAG: diguanylate cyclase [Eubacteriales bacterium]|nr:diguanylate cyclase [Eubacteriales bacterium]
MMDEKELQQVSTRGYLKVCVIFLVFMVFCIGIFFYAVQLRVDQNVESTLRDNLSHQSFHFQSMMDTEFEYLESIASYIGMQEELVSETNIDLIYNLYEKSGLERVAIIDAQGNSYYDNGEEKSVATREYFQEAMKGNRTLSDPLESMVDSSTRVILGVPIYKEDEVIGVLGGSYDVGALSRMMFGEIYDGEGYSLLVTPEGEIVSFEGIKETEPNKSGEDFFAGFGNVQFQGQDSMEQMQKDFSEHREGNVKFSSGEGDYYLAYEPLEINNWMVCYVVGGDKAMEGYRFIRQYEVFLAVVLGIGIVFSMLMLWYTGNKRQKSLFEYARTDALTGLFNKQKTEEQINAWLINEECQKIQAFFMLDIDNFKTINDVYGHAVGDEALQQVGRTLKEEFWGSDVIGRIGGDEFVVLMKNIRDTSAAISHARSFGERVRKLEVRGIEGEGLTCSIGLAYAPYHGSSYQELYKCADDALYEVKRRGRNGYFEYQDPEEFAEEIPE